MIITGQGTDVGKTVVAAIVTKILKGEYWKPIECGPDSDSEKIKSFDLKIHPPAYALKAPMSPHAAAKLEGMTIDLECIKPPVTQAPLVIETAGGIFVPLTTQTLAIDLFAKWRMPWIIVSKHYLGSINHTLLTWSALCARNCQLMGIIFNGAPNPASEDVILNISKLRCLGRLLPEQCVDREIIERYSKEWKHEFSALA